ncbi:hypothetical protein L7F22_005117 [Adiantum nelumboides]|nr:hypothetical protein [Adiantum nelumboides]
MANMAFPTFHGRSGEDAQEFLDNLEIACLVIGRDDDATRLRVFPLLMKAEAKFVELWERWVASLRLGEAAPDFLKKDRFVAGLCPPLREKVKGRFPVTWMDARDIARLKERKIRYQLQQREADQEEEGMAPVPPTNAPVAHRGQGNQDQQELLSRITHQLEDLSVHLVRGGRAPPPNQEQARGPRRQAQEYHCYNCDENGHDDIPGELPSKRGDDDHMIELIPGSSPPNKPPYRVSQAQQEEIMRQVNELVEKGMRRFDDCKKVGGQDLYTGMMGSPDPISPQMVANTFVTQYYNVLYQMPHMAHQFYADKSCLAHAEANEMHFANSVDEIYRVVTSSDHENWQPELFTVDALGTFGGSVFVLVTGAMHKNNNTRKFVQSFILAPQIKGYYVLNDILRYVDEWTEHSVDNKSYGMQEEYGDSLLVANAVPEASGSTCLGMGGETIFREEPHLPENGRDLNQQGTEESLAYPMNDFCTHANYRSREQLSVENDFFRAEDASPEKKSYASILRNSQMSAQTPVFSHQTTSWQPQSQSFDQQSSYVPTSYPSLSTEEERQETPLEVDTRSVYVRNLPPNMVDRQLEDVMRKFGPLRPNSVSVKTNKEGLLYAFVDFVDSSSAQAAIEGSPIVVGGRNIYAEGRTSVYLGGRGRGRGREQARGTSQSNGSRGRGTGRG